MKTPRPAMQPCKSSSIEAVGHDGAALHVTLRGGRTYSYQGAGAHHVEAMRGADSPGRYFQEHIRGKFKHEALT